jgi:hypothetical protein
MPKKQNEIENSNCMMYADESLRDAWEQGLDCRIHGKETKEGGADCSFEKCYVQDHEIPFEARLDLKAENSLLTKQRNGFEKLYSDKCAEAEKLREALEGLLNLCCECESPAVYLVDEDFYCSNCVLKEDALGSNIYIPNTKAIAALAQGEKGKECE